MKKRIVYLSGRITGRWQWWLWLKFKVFEIYLRSMGLDVFNPVCLISSTETLADAMKLSQKSIRKCNYVFFMPDWPYCIRSKNEMMHAAYYNIEVLNSGVTKAIYQFTKEIVDDL